MEERRLLLAVALSLLVLTAYQLMFPPPPARRGAPGPDAGPTPPASEAPGATPASEPAAAEPAGEGPVAAPEPSEARIAAERERRIEIATQDLEIALTNRGGELLSWRLLRYLDSRGRPEEMVQTLQGLPLPLSIETGDATLDQRISEGLFESEARDRIQLAASGESTLRFTFAEGDLRVEKTLRIPGEGYLIGINAQVEYQGRKVPTRLLWGPGVSNPSEAEREVQGYLEPRAVLMTRDAEVERHDADDLDEGREFADVRWGGVASTWFAAIWLPAGGTGSFVARAEEVPTDGSPRLAPLAGFAYPAGGAEGQLYVGPKDYFILRGLNRGLARVVDVGDWIGGIVVPLMRLLRWVYGHVGNYGWSIVVLTVLINLAMAPLRHISISNGAKMAKLAPEMRVIQERYRKVPALDPRRQEMQKEVAALYARHGMSMSSQLTVGCLPLLLTMPFLIGFYRVLQIFIELRGSEFFWIPDLSQKDPLFLTPLLMGASMVAMQKMTPSTLEPAQQRMMMIMPLVFVGMFLWAPSGLNLYWLSSNVCSLVQQGVTLRIVRAREKPSPKASGGKGAKAKEKRLK
jgi:YidC/Oxa1 family membrane protein insertase